MKKLIHLAPLALLLVGCGESRINQNVSLNINATDINKVINAQPSVASTPAPEASKQPSATPSVSVPAVAIPTPAVTIPTATASIAPPAASIPIILPTPSAVPLPEFDFSVFKTKIPKPDQVKGFLRSDIKTAIEFWKQRYEANKESVSAILAMRIDAQLIGTANQELGLALLKEITIDAGMYQQLNAMQMEHAIMGFKEQDVAIFYQNVNYALTLNRITYEDYDNRVIQVVRTQSNQAGNLDFTPISRPDELAPESPKDGDSVTLEVQYNSGYPLASRQAPSFYFVYDNGWKTAFVNLG